MNLAIWILYLILSFAVVYGVDFLLLSKRNKKTIIIFSLAKILLSIAFAFLLMAGPKLFRPLQPIMASLYCVMFVDGIVEFVCSFIKKDKFYLTKMISVFLVITFFIYGNINMSYVKPSYYTIESDKVSRDYKFAFISDIHFGSCQDKSTVKKYIEEINSLDLDFICLGGDITDEYTSKEEMELIYSLFSQFDCPIYYVYGNHDEQGNGEYVGGKKYTNEELVDNIESNDITILKDEFVRFNDEITILGRCDLSSLDRKEIDVLENPNENDFYLIIDHEPFDESGIKRSNADLQVSGHTHSGQFVPLNLFYNMFIGPTYGEYSIGSTTLIVSGGFGGWRVPFRTDHTSEYEIITIKKK